MKKRAAIMPLNPWTAETLHAQIPHFYEKVSKMHGSVVLIQETYSEDAR